MNRQFTLATVAALAMSWFGSGAAFAVPLSYTGSVALQSSTNFAAPGLAINVTMFDPSLGTLNSVTLTIDTSEAANVSIDNRSAIDYGFTKASATISLVTTGPGGFFNLLTTAATQPSGTALANTVTDFTGLVASNTSGPLSIGPSNFSSFEGSGSSPMTFIADVLATNFSGNSSAPVNTLYFGGGANLGVDITVAYDYTPTNTPEPASIGIIGAALAGLGWARRRR